MPAVVEILEGVDGDEAAGTVTYHYIVVKAADYDGPYASDYPEDKIVRRRAKVASAGASRTSQAYVDYASRYDYGQAEPEEPCCYPGYSTRGQHHEPQCRDA